MRIDNVSTWPDAIVRFIARNSELFDDWYGPLAEARELTRKPGDIESGPRYPAIAHDDAIRELELMLSAHTLESGFHCTRLTEGEIDAIRQSGLIPQNGAALHSRISALATAGLIDGDVALALVRENSADHPYRAEMIWFCFFEPHLAGEQGIGRLLRYWGGEALYRHHESDRARRAVLEKLGTPCVVVADVPIADLNASSALSIKLIRQYFQSLGYTIGESLVLEGYTRHPVPACAIQRIVPYPKPEFLRLTHCDTWKESLQLIR